MKFVLKLFSLILMVMLIVIAYRTATMANHYPAIAQIETIEIDENQVAQRLSEFIQIKTLSRQVPQADDELAFIEAQQWLKASYPNTFNATAQTVINRQSLLLHWPGSSQSLKPLLWTGHMDVVPVEPGTEQAWTYPAFSGALAEGDIWGRGAIDMKSTVIAMMEAVEYLIENNYQPRRDLYLALTHDEEKGGKQGGGAITQHLKDNGIQAAWSMDEGGGIGHDGMYPDVDKPVALIAVGEKGYISLRITATASGGHSSMPDGQDLALVTLANAITKLNSRQFPSQLNGATKDMMLTLAAEMPFIKRIALANLWLFESWVINSMQNSRQQAPMIRTSIAPVIIQGGSKENILPQKASVVVNFRIHPNDTGDSVLAYVEKVVAAPNIAVSLLEGSNMTNASSMANMDSPGYRLISRSIREIYGDTVVAPNMTVGGTDSKHYQAVADETYRFTPMLLSPRYLGGAHGTNEKISISNMDDMVRFYVQLKKNSDQSQLF